MWINEKTERLVAGAVVAGLVMGASALAHDGAAAAFDHAQEATAVAPTPAALVTSGQGDAVFTWDQELTAVMPEEARVHEAKMHGGFNEDVDTGIVYTGIPGYGLVAISPDLKTWTKLGDDQRLTANIHGITVFKHKGETMIAVAQNDAQKVLVVGLDGAVKQELTHPAGDEFKFEAANTYYKDQKSKFAVTDVTYLDGRIYAVTGYSPGDFVLTATETDGKWQWGPIAWGGKGKADGQFNTAHGVSAYDGFIYVANREAHQVVKFTKEGQFIEVLKGIPPGSRVCNVAKYDNDHFIFCPLAPVTKEQASAPIYSYVGDQVTSTIIPADLGVPVIKHNHHVWPHYVTGADGKKQLYLLVHGWNKGKFAVLKQVTQ